MRKLLSVIVCGLTLSAAPAAASAVIFLDDACTAAILCGEGRVGVDNYGSNATFALVSLPLPKDNQPFVADSNGILFGVNLAFDPGDIQVFSPENGQGFIRGPNNVEIGPYGIFEYTILGPPGDQRGYLPFFVPSSAWLESGRELLDLEANAAGFFMVAHMRDQQTGVSGYAAASQLPAPAPVPEPGTLLLVGSGLATLVRKHRQTNP